MGGGNYQARYYGGWRDYSYYPGYYHWMPFHPAFYWGSPYYDNGTGMYMPGGFAWGNFFFSILLLVFIFWLIGRIFFNKRVRYTNN